MKQKNPITKERRRTGRKLLAAVLSLAMILTLANPTTVFAAEKESTEESGGFWSNAVDSIAEFFGFGDDGSAGGAQSRTATQGDGITRSADLSTVDQYTLGDPDSTQYDGRVWVDKSVSKEDSVSFGDGLDVANNSDFLVTYSALATSTTVQGGAPVDVVFVLDLSASMCWGVDSNLVDNKANSRIKAMVDALNTNIAALAESNQENRIGVAVFNGTGNVLMPLTAVKDFNKVTDGQYFTLFSFSGTSGQDDGKATVMCNMNDRSANTAGGTNIQAGLYQGMNLLASADETTYEYSNGQIVTRIPNVVVMSDGAPTTFASSDDSSYRVGDGSWQHNHPLIDGDTNLGGVNDEVQVRSGSWWDLSNRDDIGAIGGGDNYRAHSADGFMALATASYMKNAISAHYYGDDWGTTAENTANVYTIGFSTNIQTDSMSTMANVVLNPGQNLNDSLTSVDNNSPCDREFGTLWNQYQRYINGDEAEVFGHIGKAGNDNSKMPDKNDSNFDPDTADENGNGFSWDWDDMHLREYIVQHPTGAAEAYDPKSFNYPTQYFAASDSQGLIDAFEQIAGLITDQAKAPTEVTGNPMSDGYITYTDTTGQYMEIKDVTTMIYQGEKLEYPAKGTDAEGNVTYTFTREFTNPAYPGQTHNTSEILITVKSNGDHTQTIEVKIPASAIPLRTNNVTLDGNGNPTSNEPSNTMPMRLCYEVGLEEGVNGAALAGVDETYLNSNTENGMVSFYSNKYQKNSTGADKGVGATVTFEPSPDNPFYFVQENTPLWVADSQNEDGTLNNQSRATGNIDSSATYYVPVTYYDGTSKVETYVARSGETLQDFVDSDENGLYIKAGSPRIGNLQDVTAGKQNNETATYGNYREPTFVYDGNQADPQQGHFLVLLGNNGKLSVPVSNLTIAKKVTADKGLTAPAGKAFTFQLTIPSKANAEGVLAVLHTEGASDQNVTLQFDENGVAKIANADGTTGDIQLEANQSLEVKGVGTTAYTVVEENATDNSGFNLTSVEGARGDNAQNSVENATASGTVQAGGSTVIFTNNYSVTPTTTTALNINLGGTKTITNRDFQPGDAFSFMIEAAQATPKAPLPDDADGDGSADTTVTINPTSDESATFSFGEIIFDKPGEYRYIIREVDYDTDNNDATVNPGGIDYDAAIYRVNIVIVDNGDGTLRLATTDEIKNTETQGDLQYTSNPMVQVNKGADSSMTGADGNAVTFNNVYNPEAATASIQGTKILNVSNSDYTLKDGDFNFIIEALGSTKETKDTYAESDFQADDTQPMPVNSQGDPVTQATNIANGNVSFQFAQGAFTKEMSGKTFGYKITESAGDIMQNGVTMDANTSRIVWITVGDDEHGHVTATVLPNDGQQQANNFTFTNSYKPEETTIGNQTNAGIEVQKTFTGHEWTKEYSFKFKIEPVSTTAQGIEAEAMPMPKPDTIALDAPESGEVNTGSFDEMTFTKAGTYTYKITEQDDNNPATNCETKEQKVTVTVTEDKTSGTLSAEVGYAENQKNAAFTNTYTPVEITLSGDTALKINKYVIGADTDADFSFTAVFNKEESGAADPAGTEDGIKDYNENFKLTGQATDLFKDGDTKPVSLSEVTFTKPGTYVFNVSEDQNEAPEGWTYDNTVRQITVKIIDDNGQLKVDGTIEAPTFTNAYFDQEDAKDVYAADTDGKKTDTSIDGQLVGVGDVLYYEVAWMNTTSAPADVVVTDTIPEGTSIAKDADGKDIISENGVLTDNTISWSLGEKAAGQSGTVSFAVVVTEDAVDNSDPENTVTNQAKITIGEGESKVELTTNKTENPVPEKSETTGTDKVTEGTTLTYQIAFKNTDGADGKATVVDELTKGQEYVKDSAKVTVNGTAENKEPEAAGTAADGQTLTWNLTGLAADAQVVLTFDVTITRDAGASVDNTATVNGHKTNVVTTPYPSDTIKDVAYADEPEVSINGQMVGVGDELLYTIDWSAEADGELTVTDTIPTGTTYVSGSADNSGSYDEKSNMITWNLGQHSEGDKGTVTFKVTVNDNAVQNDGNAIRNRAEILIGTDNPSYTTDVTNYVPEKSVIDNDPSTDGTQVGDTLTYTIQYANAGDEPVDMVITDTLDEGLTYVPYSAGEDAEYDADTRTITWTLNDVPANTMGGQVSFQAVVNEKAEGQTIENEAQITVGDNPQITTNKTETEVKTGSLTISKTVTVNTDQGTTIDTEKEFTFTVVLTDKKGNQLDGEYSYSGTSDGTTEYQGTITSTGTIKLKHEGSVTITGLPEGAEYTVTETPETGYTAENAELKGAIPADSAATAAFVNNYSAGQVTLNGATNLEVTKEFTGKDWGDEVFTFTLTQTGGDTTKVTLPDNADNLQIGKDTKDHKAAFGDIIFTAAGEYTFEISEVIPENPGQIHYDDHKATITVNVTDNKSGDLVAVASATTSGSMTFKNTYTPQEITANIQALKTMSGRDLRDTDDFTFMITPQNGAPATTRPEAHNGGQNNAVIDFGTATFTEAGTYTYLITETGGNVAGVTNSTQTITATVQVDYNEATGTLSSEVSYSGGDGDAGNMFTNVYQAAPVVPAEFETGITGTKTVTASEGNSYTMQGGEFSFTLTPAASNPSTDPVKETTITNGADGSLVFVSGPVTYTESGTYTYTVKENDSSEGGITEDGSLYTIVVEVTDSGNGQLAADVSISKDGNVTDAITFDNSYDPAKTGVTISGTKELTGKNIENNMFTFRITGDNDAPMPSATEVQNVGSSFAFGTIEYTEPGTYVYHISEVNDGKTGYTYDGTVYDVTVVVTDTDGALHADVSGADAIVFKNSYDPGQVTLTGETALRAHKTLTGRELNAEEFVFEVKDADGNVLTTGTNDADGNVVFGDLTFDQTGTYNYTISERNDSLGGITYDGTIYTVQIDVTDAGGYLEAAVQYFEGNTQTDLPEFENEYTAASTGVSLGASKILTGRDLKDGEFTFVLKDADGNTVDEAANDANGSVKFDEITYDQAGTYRYTVSEVKGDDTTITYDETVYDVTVEVADNGSGTLVPTVTIGNGDSQGIVFTNEYNEPENPTPGNEDTPDDKTPDKKPDNSGTTQSSDRANVQTGDTAQFMPVVAALLASLLAVIAIAVVMIRRRRR